jgi:hypothetical protein
LSDVACDFFCKRYPLSEKIDIRIIEVRRQAIDIPLLSQRCQARTEVFAHSVDQQRGGSHPRWIEGRKSFEQLTPTPRLSHNSFADLIRASGRDYRNQAFASAWG